MNHKYAVRIWWSDEDAAYLAEIEDLPGCMADGETAEEALKNVQIIANEWIEVAREEGRPIPKPRALTT